MKQLRLLLAFALIGIADNSARVQINVLPKALTITADGSGNIDTVIYLDPNTAPGGHTIQAGPDGPSEQVGIDPAIAKRDNPGGKPTLSNTEETGAPGGFFPFTGTGYTPGETVQLFVNGVPAGTATADANGDVNAVLEFAGGITEGTYQVSGTGQTSGTSSSARVMIDNNAPERYDPGNLPVVAVESIARLVLPVIRN
jgi:hypothetical protein